MCHEHLSPSTRQQSYVKSYLQPVSWLAALSITAPSQPQKGQWDYRNDLAAHSCGGSCGSLP